MKTSLTIPDSLLVELLEITKARSRTDAILVAIVAFIKHKHRGRALSALGSFDDFMD